VEDNYVIEDKDDEINEETPNAINEYLKKIEMAVDIKSKVVGNSISAYYLPGLSSIILRPS